MKVRKNVSVKPYTRFQIGGIVAYSIEVHNWRELLEAVRVAKQKKLPYYIVAGGSNLAFADGLLNIVLIKIREAVRLTGRVTYGHNVVRADASVQLWAFVQALIKKGYVGLEQLSGIPGTLGGAVVGNAGAFGIEISEYITRVKIYDGRKVRWITKDACAFRYRHSVFKERQWLVLEIEFKLNQGDPKQLKKISDEILFKRAKFKWDMKTPGSYFKNILADSLPQNILTKLDETKFIACKVPVGYLLETVGSKGYRVGGVYVSDFHANVLINDGTAEYSDLVTLVTELKKRVKEKFDIDLEEEVRRVDHTSFKVQP
ncbi:MAG: UDP-N-acetylmuramate dehydrogenase [Candidatus Paceibacterota bacterium]